MSKAIQGFEYSIKDAEELLAHFDGINANPPPPSSEVLKRAGLVMALTAWETYVEDRLVEEMHKKLAIVQGSYLGDFILKKLHADLKSFHNPTSDKTKKYLWIILDLMSQRGGVGRTTSQIKRAQHSINGLKNVVKLRIVQNLSALAY